VILFMNENMHMGFVGLCWYNLEKEKKEKRKNEIIAQNLTMGASMGIRFLKKKQERGSFMRCCDTVNGHP